MNTESGCQMNPSFPLLFHFKFKFLSLYMEQYLRDNFHVSSKRSSEAALRRWRSAVSVVKNPRRRFRMVADLAKRASVWCRSLPWASVSTITALVTVLLMAIIRGVDDAPLLEQQEEEEAPIIGLVSLSMSNFTLSDSKSNLNLGGTIHIGFTLRNPNKEATTMLLVVHSRASILFRGVEFARLRDHRMESISPRNILNAIMVQKMKVNKKAFAKLEEQWSRRAVNFGVRMQVTVLFEAAGSPAKSELFYVTCAHLTAFYHGDAGRLVGIGHIQRDCLVETTD